MKGRLLAVVAKEKIPHFASGFPILRKKNEMRLSSSVLYVHCCKMLSFLTTYDVLPINFSLYSSLGGKL
mgnify:CR=1 FL=1